nr:hypothetical protein OG999_29430 [Streptomyces sp. NBC_00886]
MRTNHVPAVDLTTGTTSVLSAERAVSLVLEAEVMAGLDTGMLTLIASTDHHMSDLASVCPARLRGMVEDARKRLDEFERLANEYEAIDTLRAIVAEHNLHVVEWDMSALPADSRDGFLAHYLETDGRRILVVPAGQDPIVRMNAVCTLLTHQGASA